MMGLKASFVVGKSERVFVLWVSVCTYWTLDNDDFFGVVFFG